MSLEQGTRKLANAPLVYVLAQVRYSPILSMDKYIPVIQEQVRKTFPRYRKGIIQTLSVGASGQPPELTEVHRWEFANKEANTGFILQADSFVFHTTAYETFDKFIAEVNFALGIIQNVLDLSLAERVGLRYVDVIEAGEDENLDAYLVSGLAGFPHEQLETKPVVSQTESIAETEHGRLVLRATQKKDDKLLPPDLSAPGLVVSRAIQPDRPTAILDFDHYCEQSMDFSTEEVAASLTRLHDVTSKAFWATITDYAVNKWS